MKTEFEKNFELRSPQYAFLLSRFQCAIGKEHVDYEDINTTNLHKFHEYMSGEVSDNTLKNYFAQFKCYVRECANDGLISSDKCISALKVKGTPSQNVALTEDEVQRIYDYYDRIYSHAGHQEEKDVLTLFLIECYCGARGCDVEKFTKNNIQNGMLSYVSKKTHILATIPAHKYLPKLISRISKRQYSRATKNRIIKRVCKNVGIIEPVTLFFHGSMRTMPKYECVSFHSGRRSCVTNLLNRGVPISQVAKIVGHDSINTTQRYYCSNDLQLDDAALSFFND